MATTQIKNGFHGGSDDQLLVNTDGSINVNTTGGGGTSNVNLVEVGGAAFTLGQMTMTNSLSVAIASDQSPIPIQGAITGSVTPAGLRIAGRNTTMMVSTTAVQLPVSALANRNAMSIYNKSNQTLYIGFDPSITADDSIGNTAGWEVLANESFNIDISNNIPLYGIVASGSALIKIMELS